MRPITNRLKLRDSDAATKTNKPLYVHRPMPMVDRIAFQAALDVLG